MRKLLTGACNNIIQHIEKIELWKKSFQTTTNGDVILVAFNATPEELNLLKSRNIKYHSVSNDSTETVNNSRIFPMANFIRTIENEYDIVLYTDVFDVVFLKDPFSQMDLYNYSLFVAGEGVTHGEEPWNMDVMTKCFPNQPKSLANKEVFCSGVIAGKPTALSNFLDSIWLQLLKSTKGHDIADQAAMNVELEYGGWTRLKRFYLYDKWCIHLATGGPTQFFEAWGFKQAIQNRYGLIPNWKDYAIVHQFNRIPEIENEIKKMYAS